VLKGRYTAIIISIVVHLLFIFLLIKFSTQQTQKTSKLVDKKAIKSYLYQPIIVKAVFDNKKSENKKEQPKEPLKEVAVKASLKPHTPTKPIKNKPTKKNITTVKTNQKTVKTPPLPTASPSKPFSPQESLARLRNNIHQQLTYEAFKEYSQARTATVMDGEQIPVPQSIVPLTADEKHKQNTIESSFNRITKNGDGTCTIVREQMLGSEVEGSVSSFACGESDFDKSFREHMEKVRSKLQPNKK
jgi:hypothetical protein